MEIKEDKKSSDNEHELLKRITKLEEDYLAFISKMYTKGFLDESRIISGVEDKTVKANFIKKFGII